MTDKDIKLETVYGDGEPTIGAPCAVSIKKNNKLKWDNNLDDIGGRPPNKGTPATVKLYEISDTGSNRISAEDFCEGWDDGELLVIPAKKKYDCTVIFEGEFKYDVIADGHQDLDPIIIVQPPPPNMMFFGSLAMVAAIISAVLGYRFGYFRGFRQKKA